MNHLELHPRLIRQRNEEMVREVQALRLVKGLRANRGPSSARSHAIDPTLVDAMAQWLAGRGPIRGPRPGREEAK